jgi:hypothetical protein
MQLEGMSVLTEHKTAPAREKKVEKTTICAGQTDSM